MQYKGGDSKTKQGIYVNIILGTDKRRILHIKCPIKKLSTPKEKGKKKAVYERTKTNKYFDTMEKKNTVITSNRS